MTNYRVVRGINFPSGIIGEDGKPQETRVEPGAEVKAADLKPEHLKWFLEVGAIEEAEPATVLGFRKRSPVETPEVKE